MIQDEHYFVRKPKSKFELSEFNTKLLGNEIKITSASSIFSSRRPDFGSMLLIENCNLPEKSEVLDLGCGYGLVGIAIKKARPDLKLTLSDINERAVTLATKNCKDNKVDAEVVSSDLFENLDKKKFDAILTNPPFSAGKDECIRFIKESKDHIKKGGSLQLVAPHNKGGNSLKKIMLETFGNADELVKKAGYRVYISRLE